MVIDKCPLCKTEGLVNGQAPLERTVAGKKFNAVALAMICEACGENFVTDEALEAFELAIASSLASGPADGASFKFMRRVLGLRGVDLGELFQVSGETISRWETGKRPACHRGFALLGVLVKERAAGSSDVLGYLRHLNAAAQEQSIDLGLVRALTN